MFPLWKKKKSGPWKGNTKSSSIPSHDPIINSNFSLGQKAAPVGRRLFRKRVPKITSTKKWGDGTEESNIFGLLTAEENSRNPWSCPNCKKNLTTWFAQCVECCNCGRITCRTCADYCMGTALWTCSTCVEEQEKGPTSLTSRYWHKDAPDQDLAKATTSPGSYLDHNALLAYKDVEGLTAERLGASVKELNSTKLGRVYTDSSYDLLFTRWHGELSACIKDLVQATTLGTDTTNLKAELSALIKEIRSTTMDFSHFEVNSAVPMGRQTPSYNDLLSTAILNRIIIHGQEKFVKSVSPVSNDSAVGTDFNSTSELGGGSSSEKDTHTQHWVLASSPASALERSDEESLGSNWSEGGTKQIVIQESLEEEITTTTYESDGDSVESGSSRSPGSEEAEEPPTPKTSVQLSVANWEQNWLFKRRKELLKQRNLLKEPVSMLVPNPNTESEPMIGDEKVSDIEDFEEYVLVEPKDYASTSSSAHSSRRSSEEEPKTPRPAPRAKLPEPTATVVKEVEPVVVVQTAAVVHSDPTPVFPAPKPRQRSAERSPTPPLEQRSPEPIEETLRETSHSLSYNETIELESGNQTPAQELPEMRIAAREMEKWNHPVQVKYNAYAPENLNKRLKEGHQVPLGGLHDSEEGTDFPVEKPNIERFRRDYYVNQTKSASLDSDLKPSTAHQSQSSPKPRNVVKSGDSNSELEEIHLPSVRNLAMRFNAGSREDLRPTNKASSPGPATVPAKLMPASAPPTRHETTEEAPQAVAFAPEPNMEHVRVSKTLLNSDSDSFKSCEDPDGTTQKLTEQEVIDRIEDSMIDVVVKATNKPIEATLEPKPAPKPAKVEEALDVEPKLEKEDAALLLKSVHTASTEEPEPKQQPLYQTFSRSESVPIPRFSTRALVSELEEKARGSNALPVRVKRSKSDTEPKSTKGRGAMEQMASQPLPIKKPDFDDPELKKLKHAILRGSRTRQGLKAGQIHSLTARSVSRQFREGLKLSKPAITNNNVKVCSGEPVVMGGGRISSPSNIKSDFVADKAKFWDERVRLANEEDHL